MGAAVVGIDGRTTRGVLVENVSLGLSMCAERVALFSAVTEAVAPVVLALCAPRTGSQLTFLAGRACRSVSRSPAQSCSSLPSIPTAFTNGRRSSSC